MPYKIAICGEAFGEEEDRLKMPFVGASGKLLTQLLAEAGIQRSECFLTNVFMQRPPRNDIGHFTVGKKEGVRGWPALHNGKFLAPEFEFELERLAQELTEAQPNIVIALGNTAAWALLHDPRISKIRGTVALSAREYGGRRLKVLPTYHPAAVLRQWDLRPTTIIDLQKAEAQSHTAELARPDRHIYIQPTLSDLQWFEDEHLAGARQMAVDIETHGPLITCIGFAPSISHCMVIPFTDSTRPDNNYWPSLADETQAWNFVERWLASPIRKVGQNFLYDLQYLWKMGFRVNACEDDTMLMHHSLQPEAEKGLAFLGSIYTQEASWKLMRERGKKTLKLDE